MKIAVVGADTRLGKRIAKEAYHRKNEVTAVVRDASLLDSAKYTVIENERYEFVPDPFDLIIDARGDEVKITRNHEVSVLKPPKELDPDGRRLGVYEETAWQGEYIGEEDFALAALDLAESGEAKTVFVSSSRAPAIPEEPNGRRRYVAFPEKGIAGKVYRLILDNLVEYVVHFIEDDTLILAEQGKPFTTYPCKCLSCDDGVWFVAFMRGEECVTLILDEPQRLVTVVYANLMPKRTQLVSHRILFGAMIVPGFETPFKRHSYTDELVGEKITWHYSPYVNITHCYFMETYMRNSLRSMKPVPEDAAPEAKFDAEDRVRRWSNIFFEEPAEYIRINPHLYVVCMREATRNRIDPLQGGGDMVFAINTRRMRDYGRGFHRGQGAPNFGLISVSGDWDDLPDPMDTAESPYRI